MATTHVVSEDFLVAKFNHSDLDTLCESSTTFSNLSFSSAETLLSEAISGSWQISILDMSQGCEPLSSLAFGIFQRTGLIEHFRFDATKLNRFLEEVERGYHNDVPYHNKAHAASVLHFMFLLMTRGGIAQAMADSEEGADYHLVLLASLVAAAIHDYDHVGLNNKFLEVTQHERATAWDNVHINENHHLSLAMAILELPECNFLATLNEENLVEFHEMVSALVLGTDAADDKHLRQSFEQVLKCGQHSTCFTPNRREDVLLALQIALKCADLGHLATEWSEHCQWVERLEVEFFAQGDRERQQGLEISFLMDREANGVSESQIGFFEFVALPLFNVLVDAFPGAKPMLEAVESNYSQWQEIESRKRRLCKRNTA